MYELKIRLNSASVGVELKLKLKLSLAKFVKTYTAYAHMGSFPHPMQYFAAAGENDDFVIAVINFQLNQYF